MIEIKDLYFSYNREKNALNGISLSIPDGAWVSIIGHNGSGKSTLAKILVGLLEPTKGSFSIDGCQYDKKTNEEDLKYLRNNVGIVFQNPDNQFVGTTVYKDIAFGLENRCVEREKMIENVKEAASSVGLGDLLDKEPYKLSGGQKQKVAIAGILACDLKYVIFDEATSMLDPEGSKEVIELIKELSKKENKTIITITHDLSLAKLSDYVYVLNKGLISLEGKPSEVFLQDEILEESNLIAPFNLRLYHKVLSNPKLKDKKELTSLLCQSSLKA